MRRPVLITLLLLSSAATAAPSYAGADPATPTPRAVERGVRHVPVPKAARAVDTSHPDHVVGHGTPASCTSRKVVRAVAKGGVITFDCGPAPVVIQMRRTAKVVNTSHRVVIDGGGLVTLSGMDKRRILYQDTCDPKQIWTTSHCDDQALPKLVVQHLTFADGNSTGNRDEGGGGGAILDRGGQLKIVDTHFTGNRCDRTGPDLGGAAVRALSQYHGRPVYVVNSTFRGGRCSNGSGLSSIGVSWTVLNSVFVGNKAVGHGANPQRPHTAGGGSGGAIYTDGNDYTLRVAGTLMRHNHANEGGGAIFYVSNDRSGRLHLRWSTLKDNVSAGFQTRPGIFYEGRGPIDARHSVIR
jgi:Chlamydia polymorphic membrane protein (Chlamydia_PMP) repeat